MACYLIATITVKNDSWIPDYAQNVHDIVHRHGGKYLTRTANIDTLEGDSGDLSLIALIEFPDEASARSFIADPDYAPYQQARSAGSDSVVRLIDSTDVAGTIPYLAED